MTTLSKDLRGELKDAVIAARTEAEKGSTAALEALGVADGKKPSFLDAAGEALRRRLRARGRQAGDTRRADDSQELDCLIQECAYEHWHRMLFARFLIENSLLMLPGTTLDVDFEHCEEEAKEKGLDPWEVAASYGQHMLPGVFRQDDPVLQLRLPTETRIELTRILDSLPAETFRADDSLGWTYQFWQTQRKKDVNESGVKIGAMEISPVTQLFTEDYMVEFLLHNTLGAWWAGKLGPIEAASEEDARARVALPEMDRIGVTWTYLRFVQDEETGTWSPAAGTFDGWPRVAKEVTFLDPCMGSGHFPVFALPILARLRMEEEALTAAEALSAVLRDNIHGLELDPRCTQIGAFNIALSAWKLGGYQPLPALHVACSGLAPQSKKDDWFKLAGDNDKLRRGMERLYEIFEQAPVLGSLINPRTSGDGDLLEAAFDDLAPLLEKALADETADDASHEMMVTAQGIAKAAEILVRDFTLLLTNVPYLGQPKQCEELKSYCEAHFKFAKADLATCVMQRCIELSSKGGTTALVMPQSWHFQSSYKKLRERLLGTVKWDFIARLGSGAFQTPMWEFNVILVGLTNMPSGSPHKIFASDVSAACDVSRKAELLAEGKIISVSQIVQTQNPNYCIVFGESKDTARLGKYALTCKGICSGDGGRFQRQFWEISHIKDGWAFQQGSFPGVMDFGGREGIFYWEDGEGTFLKAVEDRLGESGVAAWIRGKAAWGRSGVVIRIMGDLPVTRYTGEIFDNNVAVVAVHDPSHLPALWEFASSSSYHKAVRELNQKVSVTDESFIHVPFDLAYWQQVAAEKYPDGLPKPFSSDPTQWLFNGHPAGADQPLHVAVARLLGYQWPRQTGSSFPDCPALGPDELGRFADADGIVCLTSLRGEASATDRLRELLGVALGTWDELELLAAAGKKGSKSRTLEDWLRDEFFEQHCDLFHQRPFVWHLWDGRKDGFHALVNYHQLTAPDGGGRRSMETLIYGYLGDWITRQKDGMGRGEAGAEDRLAAALELQKELEKILAGEPPYDLFIRWKPLHRQPIGWEPDANDGVRMNARPFLACDLSRGKKGAGLFRSKFTLNWTKDRGNEPYRSKEDYPWFWNWDEKTVNFAGISQEPDGNRWNDCHYTTTAKQAARDRAAKK
jgi:hypothetical protein